MTVLQENTLIAQLQIALGEKKEERRENEND